MSLNQKIRILTRSKIVDDRGWFLKIINGEEKDLPESTGEIYAILAAPGETRAGHYHERASEWFTIVCGKAQLQLEDIESREQLTINLSEDNPQTVYVPNGIAHTFKNLACTPFILVTYADHLYDPRDTIPYQILTDQYAQ